MAPCGATPPFRSPGIVEADREAVVPDLCYLPNDQSDNADCEESLQEEVIPALMGGSPSPST
ncbi:MAG: hypothetical protein PHO89_02055 [Methylacidiphilaceae bacterium]|nr:hypothetical protein [Candidatus Methylacidiphilaceae bacterium]